MKKELHYDFRKRLMEVHKKDIRNTSLIPAANEFAIPDECKIVISSDASDIVLTAAKDFSDYLFTSMNISSVLCKGTVCDGDVYISESADVLAKRGYKIDVADKISVCGTDGWSTSQALYMLEDMMTVRRAPFVEKKQTERIFRFSPRMVHSGFGLDEYPDEHLSAIAHAGRDAILVFAKEANITPYGYLDFNDLIRRAAKYGIDVYAYSYLKITMHPDEKGAPEAYEAVYGELFKKCPGLRGIVLVGESVEFESKDEHVGSCGASSPDALPTGKPRPGWWPCCDYPKWLDLVKKSVRKYNSDADVVFWTYNWGLVDKKYRLELIENLPTDISLLVTFEMFEPLIREGITDSSSDYTIVFEGPGQYFVSEAEMAAKRGIRLYSMTNTGGMTWDIGCIPYVPAAQQWMKRYDKMIEANTNWGLCGLMESHHYGFYPSFIGDLSARVFDIGADQPECELEKALSKHYGFENAGKVEEALSMWSEAIRYHTMSNEDQYGPWRVGPAYPFILTKKVDVPSVPYALFGSHICYTDYPSYPSNDVPNYTAAAFRMPKDIEFLTKAKELYLKGISVLEKINSSDDELKRLINMGKYIACTITTGANIKRWYMAKTHLKAAKTRAEANELIDCLISIANEEIKNAQSAIAYVEYDSRLGWEPSMEYIGSKENIEWKISHLKYVLESEIPSLRDQYNM